ncbi:hypothetical protein Pmani_036119 [Petrolisthes manimaculis]|uniref:Uncharacterized protein n=1 Tax=Petrolisthes manimaculis TaxID=1843537 RepID=A0AAE1NK99_9EUCA|nr:hypothetical protein Pmani_036119 [Petrolisthes manimaculis]
MHNRRQHNKTSPYRPQHQQSPHNRTQNKKTFPPTASNTAKPFPPSLDHKTRGRVLYPARAGTLTDLSVLLHGRTMTLCRV